MKDEAIKRIIKFARQELQQTYGFVGVMDSPEFAMLNSTDNDGNDIKIKITIKKPE